MSLNLGSIPPPHTSSLPPRPPSGSHGRIPTDDRARPCGATRGGGGKGAAFSSLSWRTKECRRRRARCSLYRAMPWAHGNGMLARGGREEGRTDGRGCRWCIAMNVPSERGRSLCNVETNMHSLSFSLTLSPSRKDGGEAGCQTDRHRHHPYDRRTDQPGIGRARYVFQASGHRILELCPVPTHPVKSGFAN